MFKKGDPFMFFSEQSLCIFGYLKYKFKSFDLHAYSTNQTQLD